MVERKAGVHYECQYIYSIKQTKKKKKKSNLLYIQRVTTSLSFSPRSSLS